MNIGKRHIDHIVYAVPDLEEACDYLEGTLEVKPVFGGYHKTKGTKNALLNLGDRCYLEILAIDKANDSITESRWMGVDLITESQITRWAINSNSLVDDQKKLREYNVNMGEIFGGSRETPSGGLLQWEMILPLASPTIELAPFMVNWSPSSIHPSEALANECSLIDINFSQSKSESTEKLFTDLGIDSHIHHSTESKIVIQIKTPSGKIISLH